MHEICFDYHVQLDGDTARIAVPHHACRGNATHAAVSYTLEVLVDLDVYERLRTGNARIGVSYGHETYPLPWLVLGRRPEPGMMADHINGDGLDNRRANFCWATHTQNMQNRRGWGKMSQTMGVTFNRSTGKWVASVVRVCETRDEAEHEAQRMHALMYGPHARKQDC